MLYFTDKKKSRSHSHFQYIFLHKMEIRLFVLFLNLIPQVCNFLIRCESIEDCLALSSFGKHTCVDFQCINLDYIMDYKMMSQTKVFATTATTTTITTTTTPTTTTPTHYWEEGTPHILSKWGEQFGWEHRTTIKTTATTKQQQQQQ